jgi:hypothetical protein
VSTLFSLVRRPYKKFFNSEEITANGIFAAGYVTIDIELPFNKKLSSGLLSKGRCS